jgi:hypothetical protein
VESLKPKWQESLERLPVLSIIGANDMGSMETKHFQAVGIDPR